MSAENFTEVFTAVADNTEANTVEYNPPQVDLQPGVDPAEWQSLVSSYDEPSAELDANGNVWRGTRPKREISAHAQKFLNEYLNRTMNPTSRVIDSETSDRLPY